MKKFQWHIYKFGFCDGISPTCELGNGIDPINPNIIESNVESFLCVSTYKLTPKSKRVKHMTSCLLFEKTIFSLWLASFSKHNGMRRPFFRTTVTQPQPSDETK